MDDLEINIAITYKVPKNNLTFNGLLRGLKIDRDAIMRSMIGQILAIADRTVSAVSTGIAGGAGGPGGPFFVPFGGHRNTANLRSWTEQEHPLAPASGLTETEGDWPSFKHPPFAFLMVDGTKVQLQKEGVSLGSSELRWAWASEDVGKPFELVGFWVGKDWKTIRRDLGRRLNYGCQDLTPARRNLTFGSKSNTFIPTKK
jgi:hypothetical protein